MRRGTKVESAREELADLNAKLHGRSLLTESFYRQLMQAGFAYRQCFLVSLVPDGSNTFFGQVIRQDGRVFEFDLDLDSAQFSSWTDVTDAFLKRYERNRKSKPWAKEVVAYDFFKANRGRRD